MASQWPPRSPHEALLSTPGGRERIRRLTNRTSPSPSPTKLRNARSGSALASRSANTALGVGVEVGLDDDDAEEDEEMLQLKLQAIQARLKLKKLQAAKAQKAAGEAEKASRALRPASSFGGTGIPLQSKLAAARERMDRPQSQNAIQVPASPVRKAQSTADLQTSPQRVVLGIDKGRRAADVSLARAPSLRRSQGQGTDQQGGYLRRSKTPLPSQAPEADAPRPMSFNERLAAARTEEVTRLERHQRIQKSRSKVFSVGREEMEDYKTKAVEIPAAPIKPEAFSRDDILASLGKSKGGYLQRSNTAPSIRSKKTAADSSIGEASDLETMALDPFSGFHLSKRILPHNVLTRAISGKKTYNVKDLLWQVKAPDWSLNDVDSDVVVFAIVASKSDPRSHKPGPGGAGKPQQDRGKYMVVTLVDLGYEIELFLFNTGFERFWKLTTGTVVAILNPTIMAPPKGMEATGRFSLVINSDADTILEVGGARDLGFCKSVKKDGTLCNSWVNARRTEFCAFHTNAALDKTRSGRMELNNDLGFGGQQKYKKGMRELRRKKEDEEEEAAKRRNGRYVGEAQGNVFISAGFLSEQEREGGLAERKQREELLRKRLATQEKEREIARRLSKKGGGAGKEYMRRRADNPSAGLGSSVSSTSTAVASSAVSSQLSHNFGSLSTGNAQVSRPDARALGLVLPKGEGLKVDLGPAKRKRVDSTQSSDAASTAGTARKEIFGWGSGLKDKLARMKDGERLDGRHSAALGNVTIEKAFAAAASQPGAGKDRSPVRKKTRFITEKGIREAGRESLGEPLSAAAKARALVTLDDDDDDDDDLLIVK